MPRRTRPFFLRLALVASLLTSFAFALTPTARAEDSGVFAVQTGGLLLRHGAGEELHPTLRMEIGFRVAGPLLLGAFVQGTARALPFDDPGLGGGVLVSLRPEDPFFGFLIPSLEVSGARIQLPSQTRVDAWAASVSGGLGFRVAPIVAIEGRVAHSWYTGLPEGDSLGDTAWTVSAGVAVSLPN
jgi:hypothetical protein